MGICPLSDWEDSVSLKYDEILNLEGDLSSDVAVPVSVEEKATSVVLYIS